MMSGDSLADTYVRNRDSQIARRRLLEEKKGANVQYNATLSRLTQGPLKVMLDEKDLAKEKPRLQALHDTTLSGLT